MELARLQLFVSLRIEQMIEGNEITLGQALRLHQKQTASRKFNQLASQFVTERPDFFVAVIAEPEAKGLRLAQKHTLTADPASFAAIIGDLSGSSACVQPTK